MLLKLTKLLILLMLFDDDEPLNLILKEARITENNIYLLKDPYKEFNITQECIKKALNELKEERMVDILNEKGEVCCFSYNEFSSILDSSCDWEYWFRITVQGKEHFNNTFAEYIHRDLINR